MKISRRRHRQPVETNIEGNTHLSNDKDGVQQKNTKLLSMLDIFVSSLKEAKACYHKEIMDNKRLKD